jgi:hypothetical protein
MSFEGLVEGVVKRDFGIPFADCLQNAIYSKLEGIRLWEVRGSR